MPFTPITICLVTQGLAGAATALLQLVPIILYYIKKFFLGRTPRQAYNVRDFVQRTKV